MYRFIAPLIFFTFSQPNFAASPWMLSEGDLTYYGGLSYSTSDSSWDKSSQLEDSDCHSTKTGSHHGVEYGYSYYRTIFARAEMIDKGCGEDSYTGLGNLRIGMRGRLDVFSNGKTWELSAIIPTGYSKENPSRPGDGQFGVEGGLAYLSRGSLREFAPRWDFITSASIRYWFGGSATQFITYATARRKIGETASMSFNLNADISFQNQDDDQRVNFADSTRLSDYDKLTAKISWSDRLDDNWRYNIGASHVVWGRNAGHVFKLGITFSRRWSL